MESQAAALQAVRPDQVLDTIPNKIIGMVTQLFLTQPAIADIGNYVNQTQLTEIAYISNPVNHLFRNLIAGSFFWILSLVGFFYACLKAWRSTGNSQRIIGLILLGTIFQFIFLIAVLHISWQRYYLPMVPYACLWIAFAITQAKNLVTRQVENKAKKGVQ
jgi:Ca2+/Na+ antiporter